MRRASLASPAIRRLVIAALAVALAVGIVVLADMHQRAQAQESTAPPTNTPPPANNNASEPTQPSSAPLSINSDSTSPFTSDSTPPIAKDSTPPSGTSTPDCQLYPQAVGCPGGAAGAADKVPPTPLPKQDPTPPTPPTKTPPPIHDATPPPPIKTDTTQTKAVETKVSNSQSKQEQKSQQTEQQKPTLTQESEAGKDQPKTLQDQVKTGQDQKPQDTALDKSIKNVLSQPSGGTGSEGQAGKLGSGILSVLGGKLDPATPTGSGPDQQLLLGSGLSSLLTPQQGGDPDPNVVNLTPLQANTPNNMGVLIVGALIGALLVSIVEFGLLRLLSWKYSCPYNGCPYQRRSIS